MPREVNEKIYNSFGKGTVNFVESENIDAGAASESYNFVTYADKLELSYGRKIIGSEVVSSDAVEGLHSITNIDGTDLLLRKYDAKLQYYDSTTEDWVDIKTDLTSGNKMYFDNFYSPAGRQVWMNGEDGIFKLYPTNPGSLISLYDDTKNFKGKIKIEKSAMYVYGSELNPTTLYRSQVDKDSNYRDSTVVFDATATGVDIATEIITHDGVFDLQTGGKCTISVIDEGTVPTGLAVETTYYVIRVSETTVKLATSLANSIAGTAINISVVGTGECEIVVTDDYIGVLGTDNYTGNLSGNQIFGLLFTDGTQNVTDNKDGTLIGDGTGTINYATGAYDITFDANTAAIPTCSYLTEDPKNGGLADFTYSATRTAGEGVILRQDSTGTETLNLVTYDGIIYSLQDKGSWKLSIDSTDLVFNNEVYNNVLGAASEACAVAVSDGIVFVDIYDPANPKLRKLSWNEIGTQVIPRDLSIQFKMNDFNFDEAVSVLFGKSVVISCKEGDASANNRTIIFDTEQGSFDVMNWGYNHFSISEDKLYGGDSISPNVYEIFSGFDDLDFTIEAEWVGKNDTLDTEQLKKAKRFIVEGFMGPSQELDIYASYDKDEWSLIGNITGTDDFVDTGRSVAVGGSLYGSIMYGGEGDGTSAYFFKTMFRVRPPKFERVRIKFVSRGVGYLAITQFKWSRIVAKGFKILKKYKQ